MSNTRLIKTAREVAHNSKEVDVVIHKLIDAVLFLEKEVQKQEGILALHEEEIKDLKCRL